MNKEDPYRDQAERLRQRIKKSKNAEQHTLDPLPPRSEIHREKRTRNKWRLQYPVIRLLVLFFILLPIMIFSAYSYIDGLKTGGSKNTSGESSGFETVDFDVKDDSRKSGRMIDNNPAESQPSENTSNLSDTDKGSNIIYHTVKPNETLDKIAMNYYNSMSGIEIIKKANGISENEIRTGQLLKIPQ